MKRDKIIEVLKDHVNINGYIYQYDIEAIADELEQQLQDQENEIIMTGIELLIFIGIEVCILVMFIVAVCIIL